MPSLVLSCWPVIHLWTSGTIYIFIQWNHLYRFNFLAFLNSHWKNKYKKNLEGWKEPSKFQSLGHFSFGFQYFSVVKCTIKYWGRIWLVAAKCWNQSLLSHARPVSHIHGHSYSVFLCFFDLGYTWLCLGLNHECIGIICENAWRINTWLLETEFMLILYKISALLLYYLSCPFVMSFE